MPGTSKVTEHYSSGSLLRKIEEGLDKIGATLPVSLDVLAAVDEFHIGGRQATIPFLRNLGLTAGARVLDLGCGLGGPARFAVQSSGAQVTGIDLTPEFIEVGRALTGLAVMLDRLTLVQGSVLELPFENDSFDAAYMIHVGMNIADKAALATEVARVLKPGGKFGIYDVMKTGDDEIDFPVPWAAGPEQSALAPPEAYRDALEAAGFEIVSEIDRTQFAKAFFEKQAAVMAEADGPPPLGLHLVMGSETARKLGNLVANVNAGRISPIEIIAKLKKSP